MALISLFSSTLWSLAFSTFKILPRSGKIAWNLRSRPSFAVPPALSPSTRKISHSLAFLLVQSASFPGSEVLSKTPFLRVSSRAERAASRARCAVTHFSTNSCAGPGFSSKYAPKPSCIAFSTYPRISELPSLVLVWPSNCGSVSLTEIIAVIPSRTSSPESLSVSFKILFCTP